MRGKIIKALICLSALLVLSGEKVWAAYDASGFDDKASYDIYFYNGYGSSLVIKSIKILGFKEIAGKTFLVIKPYGFKLDDTQGYVFIDSVVAILPNQDFHIDVNQNMNLKFR